jgi:hypothetical protein
LTSATLKQLALAAVLIGASILNLAQGKTLASHPAPQAAVAAPHHVASLSPLGRPHHRVAKHSAKSPAKAGKTALARKALAHRHLSPGEGAVTTPKAQVHRIR